MSSSLLYVTTKVRLDDIAFAFIDIFVDDDIDLAYFYISILL